jgi:hypothetical protein
VRASRPRAIYCTAYTHGARREVSVAENFQPMVEGRIRPKAARGSRRRAPTGLDHLISNRKLSGPTGQTKRLGPSKDPRLAQRLTQH